VDLFIRDSINNLDMNNEQATPADDTLNEKKIEIREKSYFLFFF